MRLNIFIATLEGTVFSFEVNLELGLITPSFTAKDHIGKIKAIHSTAEGRLITAGEDENMKIYNYLSKKALSTITGIVGIPVRVCSTKRFIISGQENGQIYILGKKDGSIYHVIKAFKQGLKKMVLHESGKLLLCLSKTNRFSMWNLMTCSMVFHKKLKVEIEFLDFYSDDSLLFSTSNRIYLYDMVVMKFTQEIKLEEPTKINDIQILRTSGGKWVILGCENGYIYFYNERNFTNQTDDVSFVKFKAYEKRVKRIKAVDNYLVTISTEGEITFWDVSEILEKTLIEEQMTIEGYCSLLDYKIQSRPILLDISLRETNQNRIANGIKTFVPKKEEDTYEKKIKIKKAMNIPKMVKKKISKKTIKESKMSNHTKQIS